MSLALLGLRQYSEQADKQPQVYRAVLQRMASTPGTQVLWLGVYVMFWRLGYLIAADKHEARVPGS